MSGKIRQRKHLIGKKSSKMIIIVIFLI